MAEGQPSQQYRESVRRLVAGAHRPGVHLRPRSAFVSFYDKAFFVGTYTPFQFVTDPPWLSTIPVEGVEFSRDPLMGENEKNMVAAAPFYLRTPALPAGGAPSQPQILGYIAETRPGFLVFDRSDAVRAVRDKLAPIMGDCVWDPGTGQACCAVKP
jgi:hypothetical protein